MFYFPRPKVQSIKIMLKKTETDALKQTLAGDKFLSYQLSDG